MKTYTISEISQGGLLNKVITEIEETQEAVVVMKRNREVVLMLPVVGESLALFDMALKFGKVVEHYSKLKESKAELENYLITQIVNGLSAQALLGVRFKDEKLLASLRKTFDSTVETSERG